MTYEQARKTGNELDGYIKCTFAIIYYKQGSATGDRFFSLQQQYKNRAAKAVGAYTPNVDASARLIWDIPVFKVVDPKDGIKTYYDLEKHWWIPVTLTPKIFDFIFGTKDKPGALKRNREYWSNYDNGLTAGIDKDTVFYVREDAVEWIPTNIENVSVLDANGNEVKLDVAIQQAEKAIEEKKKMLIAAGVATLII